MKKHWWHEIAAHILAGHPDLVLHPIKGLERYGTCLLLPPVKHFFRYLLLARNGKKVLFKFGQGVFPLFEANNDFNQNYFNTVVDPLTRHLGGYSIDNAELYSVIDRATPVAIEILRGVDSPDDLLGYIANHAWSFSQICNGPIWVAAAAGRFDVALGRARERVAAYRASTAPSDEERMGLPDRQGLVRLEAALAEGEGAVLSLLKEIERRNVTMLRLEDYWQPTPFPFETNKS